MQITILFGNGLNLGYGLNTSYFKFYEYLIGQEENNEILRDNIIFKRLKEDKDNEKLDLWKDYEVKLGNITNEIGKEDIPKFDDDKIYIDECLNEFLQQENKKLDNIEFNSMDLLRCSIPLIGECQRLDDKDKMRNLLFKMKTDHFYIQPISFNYTDTVSKIFNLKRESINTTRILDNPTPNFNMYINSPFYLHGTLTDNELIVGVNDKEQIANESFKDNSIICNALIKTNLLEQCGQQHLRKFNEMISASNVICCYGLSIGETDKEYWKMIKQRLLGDNCLLIIYAHDGEKTIDHVRVKTRIIDEQRNNFYLNADCNEDEINTIKDKIIVEVNHDIFSLPSN